MLKLIYIDNNCRLLDAAKTGENLDIYFRRTQIRMLKSSLTGEPKRELYRKFTGQANLAYSGSVRKTSWLGLHVATNFHDDVRPNIIFLFT